MSLPPEIIFAAHQLFRRVGIAAGQFTAVDHQGVIHTILFEQRKDFLPHFSIDITASAPAVGLPETDGIADIFGTIPLDKTFHLIDLSGDEYGISGGKIHSLPFRHGSNFLYGESVGKVSA